jgi:hypothetical protein
MHHHHHHHQSLREKNPRRYRIGKKSKEIGLVLYRGIEDNGSWLGSPVACLILVASLVDVTHVRISAVTTDGATGREQERDRSSTKN